MTRTAIQQTIYDEAAADAKAGRPATPPAGGKAIADAYNAGYASVTPPTPAAPKAAKATSSSPRRRPAPATRSRPASTRARRRRPGPARVRRQVTRELVRPIESNVVSGAVVLGTAAAVSFLYYVLVNASTTATAIDKVTGAVKWLDSLDPIPYRK